MSQEHVISETLRVLIVEDSEDDARLVLRELRRSGYEPVSERVDSEAAMRKALADQPWELILSDYVLPGFGGLEALRILKESSLDLPFVLVSNKVSEETLVEAMRAGATDFVMKDRLSRLGPVVKRELVDAAARRAVIAARNRVRETLEKSERHYRKLIEGGSDVFFIIDPKGKLIYRSESGKRLTGWDNEDVLGRDVTTYVQPDYLPAARNAIAETLRHPEKVTRVELRLTRKDGSHVDVEALGRNLLDDPDVGGIVVTAHDITERELAASVLRDSEQNYRTLADSSPALIWASGTDKLCNYFNQPWLRFTGRTLEQEMGNGWAEGVHPDDFVQCLATYTGAFDRREPFSMEYRLRRHDGEFRWVRDDGCPRYDSKGEFIGYLGYVMDITDRRRAEDALLKSEKDLKEAQRLAQIGSWDWDAATDTITWSDEYYRIYGFAPAQRPPGYVDHLKAYTPESAARLDAAVKKNMQTGEPYELDLELAGTENTSRWVTARSEAKRDTQGRIAGLRGTAQDITERRRADQALRESEETLRMIAASAQDAILMIDNDGRIALWNAAATKLFGYSGEEAVGEDLHLLLAPARFHEAQTAGFSHFRSTGAGPVVGKTMELAALRKEGAEFPIELSLSAVKLKDKWHAVGIVRDITARKHAEQSIAAQLDELRRWHELNLDREERLMELKHEVNELLGRLNESVRYPSAE